MSPFVPTEHPHRRFNPLTGQWILVCPHRMKRPWSGEEESPQKWDLPEFDLNNPLCPNVTRPCGQKNPNYESTFVFTNDFPALLENAPIPAADKTNDPLFKTESAIGTCRVMCFHPKSNKTLPVMTTTEIRSVIDEWINQYKELMEKYIWVQIFENKGTAMGCSNTHPHCQIWSCAFLPSVPEIKNARLYDYYAKYKRPLLDDYIIRELEKKERVVIDNEDWLVVVPYWASWPFETMIISKNKNKRISDLTSDQSDNLAVTIKELTTKYDNLFKCSFPYSMGIHGAPTAEFLQTQNSDHWTLHAIYYPPLLRSATVRKFMVGFELLSEIQRDLTAEQAAERLRQMNGKLHYSEV